MKKFKLPIIIFTIFLLLIISLNLILPKIVLSSINRSINGYFTAKRVSLTPFSLTFKNFDLKDENALTILSGEKLQLRFSIWKLLFYKNKIFGLNSLTLDTPEIYIKRYKNGKLNFLTLTKPSGEKSDISPLSCAFTVNNGTLNYSDSMIDLVMNFKDFNFGMAREGEYYSITADATENFMESGNWKISGKLNLCSPAITLRAVTPHLNVEKWLVKYLDFPQIKCKVNTTAVELSLLGASSTLDSLSSSLYYSLEGDIVDALAAYLPFNIPLSKINGKFHCNSEGITVENARMQFPGGNCAGEFFLNLTSPPTLDGQFDFNISSIKKLVASTDIKKMLKKGTQISGAATGNIKFSGTTADPHMNLTINGKQLNISGTKMDGNAFLDIRKDLIEIRSLQLEDPLFYMSGSGWFFPLKKEFLLSLNCSGIPPANMSGLALGNGRYSFKILGDSSDPLLYGNVALDSIIYQNRYLGAANAQLLYSDKSALFPSMQLRKEGGNLSGAAFCDMRSGVINGIVSASSFPVSEYVKGAASTVSGDFALFGTMDSPILTGKALFPSFTAANFDLQNLQLPLVASKQFAMFAADATEKSGVTISTAGMTSPEEGFATLAAFKLDHLSELSKSNVELPKVSGSLVGSVVGSLNSGFTWDGTLNSDHGSAQSLGQISLPDKKIFSYLSMENLQIAPAQKGPLSILDTQLKNGELLFLGKLEQLSLYAFSNIKGSSFAGIPFDFIQGDAKLENLDLKWNNLAIWGSHASIRSDANLSPKNSSMQCDFTLNVADIHYLLNKLQLDPYLAVDLKKSISKTVMNTAAGPAVINANASLNGGKPLFTAAILLKDDVLNYETLNFSSILSFTPAKIFFDQMAMELGPSRYAGHGFTGYKITDPIAFKLNAKNGDLKRLLALAPSEPVPVQQGKVFGKLDINGTYSKPVVNGNMMLADCVVAGEKIHSLNAYVRTENHTMYVDDFHMFIGDGEISGSGSVASDGTLDFTFSSAQLPVASIKHLQQYITSQDTHVDMIVRITGTTKKPVVTASIKGEDLVLMGYKFDSVVALFNFKNSLLNISDMHVTKGDEEYTCSGTLDSADLFKLPSLFSFGKANKVHFSSRTDLSGSIRNGDLPFLLSMAKLPAKDFQGKLNLDFNISTKSKQNTASLSFELVDAVLGGIPLNNALVSVNKVGNMLNNILIDIAIPGGSFKMYGDMSDSADSKVLLEGRDFDLKLLSYLFSVPEKYSMEGAGDLNGYIYGAVEKPNISLNADINNFLLGGVPLGKFVGRLQSSNSDTISFSVDCDAPEQKITAIGTVPFLFENGLLKFKDESHSQLKVHAQTFDLLSLFLPIDKGGTGRIRGDLSLDGAYPDMQLSGNLSIRDGVVTPSVLKNSIKSLSGDLKASNGTVVLERASGLLGDGLFRLNGIVNMNGFIPETANLNLQGDKLQIDAKSMLSGLVSADLNMILDHDKKSISGKTVLSKSMIVIPPELLASAGKEEESEDSNKSDTPYSNLPKGSQQKEISLKPFINPFLYGTALDLGITVEKDVWVLLLSSQVETVGKLDVKGVLEAPLVNGHVDMYKGSIVLPLFSTPFKLYRGTLTFPGDGFIPNVLVVGESTIGDYTASLTVTGQLNSPHISIDSDMPGLKSSTHSANLNDSMIYDPSSRTKGHNIAQGSDVGNLAMQSVLEFGVMRPILNQLVRTVGLSEISFDFNSTGNMTVKVAKAIDRKERFLLTYEYGNSFRGILESMYGMEYRFARGYVFKISHGSTNTVYVWVQMRKKF